MEDYEHIFEAIAEVCAEYHVFDADFVDEKINEISLALARDSKMPLPLVRRQIASRVGHKIRWREGGHKTLETIH